MPAKLNLIAAGIGIMWVTMVIVASRLATLIEKVNILMVELDALKAQVKASTDLEASAILLITGIAAQIEQNKLNPAALTDLAGQLKASGDALAAAITANTGLIPAPAPEPPPAPAA
jgi:hypothetical protein